MNSTWNRRIVALAAGLAFLSGFLFFWGSGASAAAPAGKGNPPAKAVKETKKEVKEEDSEEDFLAEREGQLYGDVEAIGRALSNRRESAKLFEYRDFGAASGNLGLRYRSGNQFYELKARDIGQEDQRYGFTTGHYGTYKLDLGYNQIPHRFAFDGRTLYTAGLGTGDITAPTATRTNLQASTSTTDAANRLNTLFATPTLFDTELLRRRANLKFQLTKFDPFTLKADVGWEQREGTRPFFASFGFGNAVELPEPVFYKTLDGKVTAEYAGKKWLVSGSYAFSNFKNETDTLVWDNLFRTTDSTSATAYAVSNAAGAARGLIDLYPNNTAQTFSFMGSAFDLPGNTRITASGSWTQMRQNDLFVPYTTNTAIVPGAVVQSGAPPGSTVPFNASNVANLPARSANAKVDVTNVDVVVTSTPVKFLNLKGRYRLYDSHNRTPILDFPGMVNLDGVWRPAGTNQGMLPQENEPASFKKQLLSAGADFRLSRSTTLGLSLGTEQIHREHREVAQSVESQWKIFLDSRVAKGIDLRSSYERATRRGDYNYSVPYANAVVTPQLPFLRKLDMANRDRERAKIMSTFTPAPNISFSLSVASNRDAYKDSPFGLRQTKSMIFSADADWNASSRLDFFGFFSYEGARHNQRARQWTPSGGIGDPYTATRDPGYDSNSNWAAEGKDRIHTLGGGFTYTFKPEVLDLHTTFSYSENQGRLAFFSPLGTAANDNNAVTPVDFPTVDHTRLTTLDARLRYNVTKQWTATLGYFWQQFAYRDFNTVGFTYIPVTATGAYQGVLLAGTLPKDYNAHMIYAKATYKF